MHNVLKGFMSGTMRVNEIKEDKEVILAIWRRSGNDESAYIHGITTFTRLSVNCQGSSRGSDVASITLTTFDKDEKKDLKFS